MQVTRRTRRRSALAAGTAVALIVAPAAAARQWSDRIATTTAIAVGLGMASGVVGLAVSQAYAVAAGAAIVLAACGFFVLSVLVAPLVRRRSGPMRPVSPNLVGEGVR